ncbi:unnamed protein product, partial [Cladocopium goreaui]
VLAWLTWISSAEAEPELRWLWGTQVLAKEVPEAAELNQQISAYLLNLSLHEPPEIRSNRNGAWQSRNKKFLDFKAHPKSSGIRKQVKRLREAVDSALKEYLGAESEAHAVQIEASWANVNPACGLNGPHVHPFAALSGAYYVNCGNNATSRLPCAINLMDPRPSAPMAALPAEVRDALDFGIDWTLSLWPGTVLIFPSWLSHWVPPNSAPRQRMTISFNAGLALCETSLLGCWHEGPK